MELELTFHEDKSLTIRLGEKTLVLNPDEYEIDKPQAVEDGWSYQFRFKYGVHVKWVNDNRQ